MIPQGNTFIEKHTNLTVHTEIIEVKLQSSNMEREGLVRSLYFLLKHVKISEVITDASSSVHKKLGKT